MKGGGMKRKTKKKSITKTMEGNGLEADHIDGKRAEEVYRRGECDTDSLGRKTAIFYNFFSTKKPFEI